jgi:hypothetical protein
MLLRVETSATLNTKSGRYLKEGRVLEMDLEDAVRLLSSDPELHERYFSLRGQEDPKLTYELLLDAFDSAYFALRDGLIKALEQQLQDWETPTE